MTKITPNAIYIGPSKIADQITRIVPEWNFVAHVENIDALWQGLNDGTITNDVHVIITVDPFFDPSGQDISFENLVSAMSPYCFFVILQYKPALEMQIRERIENEASAVGNTAEFFFVSPQKPRAGIDKAKASYIRNSSNAAVAAILDGRDPELEAQKSEVVEEVEPAPISEEFSFDDNVESDYLGHVIAVTSSKGGSGKSTVAVSLATYLAHTSINSVKDGLEQEPLKIVILDLDVRDGQIGFLTGSLNPSVLNMRSKGINDATLEETIIKSSRLNVDLLLAPKRPRLSDDTPPEFYLELIQFLKRHYDYIILDTSVNYLDPLLEKVAYPIADAIVFVTDIVVNSVYSMTRWVQEVTRSKENGGMGIPRNKIGIVVNKSITNVNMDGKKIAKSAPGIPVISVIPNNAKLIAHAANIQAMEQILKHPDIRLAIRRLARAIVGQEYNLSETVF